MPHRELLSTGQVAELCAVTPDTVLKWIKRGKLAATRTAGGHYRVTRGDVGRLVAGLAEGAPTPEPPVTQPHCWEFYASDEGPRASCLECIVYRSRALRCFELSHLAREDGYAGSYCQGTCLECPYYLQFYQRPISVLVITDNPLRQEHLIAERDHLGCLELHFAHSVYEAAVAIERARPDYVLLDCLLSPEACLELCENLEQDARIPDVVVFIARHDLPGFDDRRCLPEDYEVRDLQTAIWALRRAKSLEHCQDARTVSEQAD